MHKFVLKLLTEWRKLELPFSSETIVVAVSGGADSISAARAFYDLKQRQKLNLRFVLAHVNHGLRGAESDADELAVQEFAAKFGFELAATKVKVSKNKGNLEQNARIERYKFLQKTVGNLNAHALITAHTQNDQAETFLMNLIRGSGLSGLGAMRVNRPFEDRKSGSVLVRPLLTWATREMTEQYCIDCGVEYRYDSMNEDTAFRRVRIRKILLPLLKDFNPKIIESLANTAFLLQSESDALDKVTEIAFGLESMLNKNFEKTDLEISGLINLFPSIRRKILRDWLESQRGNLRSLDLKHVESIENLILSRKSGKIVELPNSETVTKHDGKLSFLKKKS